MFNQLDIFHRDEKDAASEAVSLSTAPYLDVPDDASLDAKQYYPIGEVAEMFHVNISLLRFWEKEFDILKPRKNRKGDRLFRPEDIRNLKLIHFLLKDKKVNESFETIQVLKNIRAMLLELKSGLA
jgi:MerR HTH family regulatory protein